MSVGASERREIARWTISAAVVVLVHAGAAAALVTWEPGEPAAPSAALVIDLAPLAAAPPAPELDVAPGPQQEQTDPPPEPVKEMAELEALPDPEPPPPEPEPEPPPPPEVTPPKPEVAIAEPPPKPPDPPKPKPVPRVKQTMAPRPNQQLAALPTAPTQGLPTISNANAIPNWRSQLVAHLERHKRYPSEAQSRREQGVAQISFSIDRNGNVTSARLVRSSGYPALDAETVAMVQRASPVPAPPPEMGGHVSLTVPVRFNMR